MQYCRGGNKFKHFSPRSDFTDLIFTGKLSGMDSAGVLRQGVLSIEQKHKFKQTTDTVYKGVRTNALHKAVFRRSL